MRWCRSPTIAESGNLKSSTLLRKVNRGDPAGAAAEFAKWNKAGGRVLSGLTRRRAAEATLFQGAGRIEVNAREDGPMAQAVDAPARPTVIDTLTDFKIAQGTATGSALGSGNEAIGAVQDTAAQLKDATDAVRDIGLIDFVTALVWQPRFWIAVAILGARRGGDLLALEGPFMSWLTSLIPGLGPVLAAFSAAWSFLASPFGRLLAVAAVAFVGGWQAKAHLDETATARAVIAKQRIDLRAAQDTAEQANAVGGRALRPRINPTRRSSVTCRTRLAQRPAGDVLALSIPLLLTACAGSGSGLSEVVRRDLPAAPAYLTPVAVPDPKAGEDALNVAARERAGRLKANSIIRNARAQWERLRTTYRRGR